MAPSPAHLVNYFVGEGVGTNLPDGPCGNGCQPRPWRGCRVNDLGHATSKRRTTHTTRSLQLMASLGREKRRRRDPILVLVVLPRTDMHVRSKKCQVQYRVRLAINNYVIFWPSCAQQMRTELLEARSTGTWWPCGQQCDNEEWHGTRILGTCDHVGCSAAAHSSC